MRYYKYVLLLILVVFVLPSCKKYLDVQPDDLFLEKEVYTTRTSVRNALNGIYLDLAKADAYGENFTCTTMDVLAQYYDCSFYLHKFGTMADYKYKETDVMARTSAMWANSYAMQLSLNVFIKNVTAGNNVLPEEEKKLVLGEAYGLRAFLMFDLLRLFGPVYASDSTKTAIPYPLEPASQIQPLLPANTVMANVLKDLNTAAGLLEKDPIRTGGIKGSSTDGDTYFTLRNRRMNYYAVKALTARALLYQGNRTDAGAVANALIKEAAGWFPWSPAANSAPGILNPDRVFSSEVIFGMDNANLYTTQTKWFSGSIAEQTQILMPVGVKLSTIYEGYENDYRYRTDFKVDRNSNRTSKTFSKYEDIESKSMPYRKLQPLIRLSELYYIAAECETSENTAIGILNTVRFNRGLPPLTVKGDKQQQITLEYRKEFWGEGQLFFYYKRTRQPSILSGSSFAENVDMKPENYVVPLPLNETSFR